MAGAANPAPAAGTTPSAAEIPGPPTNFALRNVNWRFSGGAQIPAVSQMCHRFSSHSGPTAGMKMHQDTWLQASNDTPSRMQA